MGAGYFGMCQSSHIRLKLIGNSPTSPTASTVPSWVTAVIILLIIIFVVLPSN